MQNDPGAHQIISILAPPGSVTVRVSPLLRSTWATAELSAPGSANDKVDTRATSHIVVNFASMLVDYSTIPGGMVWRFIRFA